MWSQAMICINITFSTNNMSNRLAGHHHDNLYKGCRSHPDYKLFSPCLHHMHIHACLKTCTNTCTFTHINIQKHASTYSDMSTHKYSKIWKHIFTLQILVMYIYSYKHTHTHTRICTLLTNSMDNHKNIYKHTHNETIYNTWWKMNKHKQTLHTLMKRSI